MRILAIYIEHNDLCTEAKESFDRGGVHARIVKEEHTVKIMRQVTVFSRELRLSYCTSVID